MLSLIVLLKELGEKERKCLLSIKQQKGMDFEVIVIDYRKEIKEISDMFSEYKYSYYQCETHENEIELFKRSLEMSRGEFIQFVDASDELQIDWCYNLKDVLKKCPELVIGRQVYATANNTFFDFNFSICKYLDEGEIDKNSLLKTYIEHGGEDRSLMSLNNKVIKKTLLKKILNQKDALLKMPLHIREGIVFFMIFFAEKIINTKKSSYIYGMEKEQESVRNKYKAVVESYSNLLDMMEIQLSKLSNIEIDIDKVKEDWYKELICRWRYCNPNEEDIKLEVENVLNKKISIKHDTSFFESTKTYLGHSYFYHRKILEFIASNQCEYVGFDIFDTLIERPFWEPTDLFYLLNDKYNQLVGKNTCIDFSLIRKNGEAACREHYFKLRPHNEDVILHEIYQFISEHYGIKKEITDELEAYEIELETKYCRARFIGKELFEWARICNKKIIIISDMYLPLNVIENILNKNGYNNYERLFLSNEIGKSKYSGKLFKYVLKTLEINNAEKVCFIGDNYSVDYINSNKCGIIPFHVPKASELFMGMNKEIYTGKMFEKIYCPNGGIIDQGTVLKFVGIKCMMAVVANKIFGNPFVNFNEESDFNADPEYIGYLCAGMFLFAEVSWLLEEGKRDNVNKIHFVSRDGYWVKEAYDSIREVYGEGPKSNYLYSSRKVLAPLYMEEKEGIYELFLLPHVVSQTPNSVLKLLKNVIKCEQDNESILLQHGIQPEKKFANMNEYYLFAKVFTEKIYNREKAIDYSNLLKMYYKEKVSQGDVLYDVGYSGRMETALTRLLGFPINSYYFHEHEPWALMRKRMMNFNIKSFYSFKPCSAFVLREQIFTPAQASCVGFRRNKDYVEPVFGKYKAKFKETFILDIVQRSSIKFVNDMVKIFGTDLKALDFNPFDACIPFEFYLHYSKDFDRRVLSAIDFEDEFGTNMVMSMKDYWNEESKIYALNGSMTNTIRKGKTPGEKFVDKMNELFPMGTKRRDVVRLIVQALIR